MITEQQTANILTAAILAGITERSGGRAWRNNRIDAMAVGRGGKMRRVIAAGINGQADITGILRDGRRIEIEIKIGHDKQSPVQLAFAAMIEDHHGVYIVARDLEQCLACIEDRLRLKL